MSDGVGEAESGIEIVGILILLYLAYQAYKQVSNAFTLAGASATFVPGVPWVGTPSAPVTTPLTASHARSIAMYIGVDNHGGGYQISPDGTQIWFFDGSYFDNTTGTYFSASGENLGPLMDNNQNSQGINLDAVESLNLGDPGQVAGLGG